MSDTRRRRQRKCTARNKHKGNGESRKGGKKTGTKGERGNPQNRETAPKVQKHNSRYNRGFGQRPGQKAQLQLPPHTHAIDDRTHRLNTHGVQAVKTDQLEHTNRPTAYTHCIGSTDDESNTQHTSTPHTKPHTLHITAHTRSRLTARSSTPRNDEWTT